VAAISTPAFWLALVLILVFAQTLRLLPSAGATGPLNLILPAATVAFAAFGMIAQVSRSALIGQLELPYTLTARAKGLSRPQVLARHTARNSAIPVLTVFGSEIASLVNGAVVVEVIFGWPGIGNLFITAIRHRDLPLIEACVFVTSVLVILINLIIDIAYFRIDPRIRTQPGIRPRPTVTASIRQAQTPTTP
jgi:peptide/nickel transport system permease protein